MKQYLLIFGQKSQVLNYVFATFFEKFGVCIDVAWV